MYSKRVRVHRPRILVNGIGSCSVLGAPYIIRIQFLWRKLYSYGVIPKTVGYQHPLPPVSYAFAHVMQFTVTRGDHSN